MSDRYLIPAQTYRAEEIIKRSRFIVTVAHTPDSIMAKEFVDSIKKEFPDATHNCWAYAAGPPAESAMVGMSDDGEPHGTAGRPMLNVILHAPIGEVAVVVTRYFGGTKLGTGGLVRAYSSLTQLGLESVVTKEKVDTLDILAVLPYTSVTLVKRLLPELEVEVLDEEYGADVAYTLRLPRIHFETLQAELCEMTDGRAEVASLDTPDSE